MTNEGNTLISCFNYSNNFLVNANKFYRNFKDIVHKSFSKVRLTNKTKQRKDMENDSTQVAMNLKRKIIAFKKVNKCKIADVITEAKIQECESEIANSIAKKEFEKIKAHVEQSQNSDGSISQNKIWKLKGKVLGTKKDPPSGMFDKDGKFITSPSALKELFSNE